MVGFGTHIHVVTLLIITERSVYEYIEWCHGETLIQISNVYEEQNVKQCECNVCKNLSFVLLLKGISCVTILNIIFSYMSIGILTKTM